MTNAIRQQVAITNARFFSPIGYYKEERILGNEFFVHLEVNFKIQPHGSDDLDKTLNYELLYSILKDTMAKERKLLESAGHEIIQELHATFGFLDSIRIEIVKTNPPFGGDKAQAKVVLEYVKGDEE